MSLAAGAKSSSAEIFSSEGAFPLDNAGAGLETNTAITGTNVASVTVARTGAGTVTTPGTSNELGTIVIAFNANNATLNGNSVTLTANSSGGSITWVCTSTLRTRQFLLPAVLNIRPFLIKTYQSSVKFS